MVLTQIASGWALANHQRAHFGEQLGAALHHFVPELPERLPLFKRALQGWRRLDPANQRSPLSKTCTGAIAHWFAEHGEMQAAAATVLSFDGFFREEDWSRLCGRDVSVQGADVAITLGVMSRGEKCKTGYDQGVLLTTDLAKGIAIGLKAQCADTDRLFSLSEDDYRARFHHAVGALDLPPPDNGLPWVPHCLRHGGASEAFRAGMSVDEIKLRGRWRNDKSVARYTKPHQLLSLDARINDDTRRRGLELWEHPERCFAQLRA